MINHRSGEFRELLPRVAARLRGVFRAESDPILLTTSGTGGLEAAVANTLSPGDRVLAVTVGAFGDRFASIAEAYGAAVTRLASPPGEAADPEAIRKALRDDSKIRAVLVTHNETATGVTNDVETIGRIVREAGPLLLVDAVSSLGAIPLETSAWGLDVVVTASQKAWMTPPGLAMVAVGPRAWEASSRARMPRFYFDFERAKSFATKGETPWTPAVSILFALDAALDRIESEGIENVFERHRRLAARTRDGLRSFGFRLLAEGPHASDAVTAAYPPEGFEADAIRARAAKEFDVVLSGGQGPLKGKILRLAHLGWVSDADVEGALDALRRVVSSAASR